MQPIQELLNKIKRDPNEEPDAYVIFYQDRVSDKLIPVPYDDILEIRESFITIFDKGHETPIPLHRIKKVEKKGEVVWER